MSATRNTLTNGLLLILTAACSGGGTGPSGGGADFSATIAGVGNWTGTSLSTQAVISTNGSFTITGTNGGANGVALSITLFNIKGPGTYPFGVGGSVRGGLGTVSQGTAIWSTPLSGSAGTVIITSVSNTRIVGTFNFTATPFVAGTTGNKEVSSGEFDLPVTGSGSITFADNIGSLFGGPTGTLGGAPWNAATVVTVSHPSSGTLTIGASNVDYNINVIISGFTGIATYQLGTGVARTVSVIRFTGGLANWGGTNASSGGTLTVTSYTQTRVQGSYNILLQPASGTSGTLALIGAFDVGLP